ncbi:MAG: hypothetical protein M1834_006026 [Cirrosporium novae-zelandiae]|nr:MAG: hypothetical protein M1834_006026 [Cirrosporium novae-zelandiae]
MPPTRTSNAPKRGRPSFKPPRPSGTPYESTPRNHGKPSKSKSKSTSTPTTTTAATADPHRAHSNQASSSSRRRQSNGRTAALVSNDPNTVIPQKLLSTITKMHFKEENTKMGVEAGKVLGKYVEVFVRETIVRAQFERERQEAEGKGRGGMLEVEDLEKVAPQLLLDF